MAETREARLQREKAAQQREKDAQLHALMQASACIRIEATPPKLLTVRVPKGQIHTYKLRVDPTNLVTWENRDAIQIAEYDDLCAPHLAH